MSSLFGLLCFEFIPFLCNVFVTFQNFFRFFQKNFQNMHLFALFLTLYIWNLKIRPVLQSDLQAQIHNILPILGIVLCRICHFPGDRFSLVHIDDILPFPWRDTRSFLMLRQGMSGEESPSAREHSATSLPVLSDDAALCFLYKIKQNIHTTAKVGWMLL